MKNIQPTAAVGILVWCILVTRVYAAPPAFNVHLGVANEDFSEGDSDTYTQLTGSVRYSKGLSRNSVTNLNADIYTRSYSDIAANDRNGILLEAFYNYVPTLGFTKPMYSIGVRQEFEDYDNDASDLSRSSLILADTLRVDDQFTLSLGLEFIVKSSDAIDTETTGLFANMDFHLSNRVIIYANLKLQDEEITSTASMAGAMPRAAREEVAGAHLPGEPGYVGPVTGSTNGADDNSRNTILALGVNYFIDSNQAIDISFETIEYDADMTSTRDIISFDYFYKF